MKITEIHIVFNSLDGTTQLSRSEAIEGIQRPDQPHSIQLTRLMFEGGYMLQNDDELTVIQKNDFKITYRNDEPENLVIHGDGKNPEPAGFEGDVMDLLQDYECPISCDDLIKMRTAYTRLMLTIS
ncbi:hypothetical protein MXM19_08455 [Aeromonas caviae]|uniref:hypothetical protein n=1 Tax=Aeromonas caviae TaxID=648 RepID=UPI002DBCDAE8|nr:hypothetical protein [Aeromonas caviae]MEB6640877.1 hypothetical protein [Aeromonas caviae]